MMIIDHDHYIPAKSWGRSSFHAMLVNREALETEAQPPAAVECVDP